MKSCTYCGSTLRSGTEKFCTYCGKSLLDQTLREGTVIDCLPIALNYREATKVKVENPKAVRISKALLEFHPYYLFEYTLDAERTDPIGKNHRIQDEGKHVVDALTGQLASATPVTGLKHTLSSFLSKNLRNREEPELDDDVERNQIIDDLRNIEPIYKHLVTMNPDFNVNIIEDKVSLRISEKLVLQQIKADNTTDVSYTIKSKSKGKIEPRKMKVVPTYNNISIKRRCLIYIPKWVIIFKAGSIPYKRKVLAASNRVVVDEIAFCPKHFSLAKIWTIKKQTYAVCEICGTAYCIDHIFNIDGSYYCENDRIPNKRNYPTEA